MNPIRYWRLERGFSQKELAEASQVPRYEVQMAENNLRVPRMERIQALAFSLNVSPTKLFPQLFGFEKDWSKK